MEETQLIKVTDIQQLKQKDRLKSEVLELIRKGELPTYTLAGLHTLTANEWQQNVDKLRALTGSAAKEAIQDLDTMPFNEFCAKYGFMGSITAAAAIESLQQKIKEEEKP